MSKVQFSTIMNALAAQNRMMNRQYDAIMKLTTRVDDIETQLLKDVAQIASEAAQRQTKKNVNSLESGRVMMPADKAVRPLQRPSPTKPSQQGARNSTSPLATSVNAGAL